MTHVVKIAHQIAVDPNETPPRSIGEWLGRSIVAIAVVAGVVTVVYCLYELALYIKDLVADRFSKETNPQLEAKACKKGLGDLVCLVKQIPSLNQRNILWRLSKCKAHEVPILNRLTSCFIFSADQLKELLMGAHIWLKDEGRSCTEWSKLPGIKKRISSHRSDGQQYGVRGTLIKELLFTSLTEKGIKYTSLQFENNPTSFGFILRHTIDYFKYKISSLNQGPYGSSSITDRKPLIIEPKMAH
jgi:hypothetical protein